MPLYVPNDDAIGNHLNPTATKAGPKGRKKTNGICPNRTGPNGSSTMTDLEALIQRGEKLRAEGEAIHAAVRMVIEELNAIPRPKEAERVSPRS